MDFGPKVADFGLKIGTSNIKVLMK
jgi:hypothetical protein